MCKITRSSNTIYIDCGIDKIATIDYSDEIWEIVNENKLKVQYSKGKDGEKIPKYLYANINGEKLYFTSIIY